MPARKRLMRLERSLMTTTICPQLVVLGMRKTRSQPDKWKKFKNIHDGSQPKLQVIEDFLLGSGFILSILMWCLPEMEGLINE
jgi:hypothetical protein